MRWKQERKPYKIVGAYDSETTNIVVDGVNVAFPMLHQLGLLECDISEVTPENVESMTCITLYRHAFELFEQLDKLCEQTFDYVPVILCHNLAFDMYGLSSWLTRKGATVLAKSARKPITFTIKDDAGKPRLVIWDTLIFSQQSLERMGKDCGYVKGVGMWDYDLVRTPDTPLSPDEVEYAKRDIYTLLSWLSWWIARNPEIEQERLALNVVTKTGVVRERRRVRFSGIKKQGQKHSVGDYWLWRARTEAPETDDELFTMLASTRGGFTFCAEKSASVPYDLSGTDHVIAAYDATSQHPAQMVSHVYPINFHEATPTNLKLAFDLIGKTKREKLMKHWEKPFSIAFNACFEFVNLRPKPGSIYERFGIMPIASARYRTQEQIALDEDNGDKAAQYAYLHGKDYKDSCINPKSAFGKLISADYARLYMTELTAYEMHQAYTWDEVRAVHGYMTGRFSKPNDYDVISVMQFYKAKNEFKRARGAYYKSGAISNGATLRQLGVADAIVSAMENGTLSSGDVEATYLSLKADLNALYGVNCANEYRRDTVLDETGIGYQGEFGICNRPKNPKVWYQFGQRIVGWSRIAQIMAMQALEPYAKTVINGDTDSIKIILKRDDLPKAAEALREFGAAIDKGKNYVCSRIKSVYPELFDPLHEIGYYILEETTDRFCASWNKAYCTHDLGKDGKRHFAFTLAGIPTRKRESAVSSFIGINGLADRLHALGMSYEQVCNVFLGYNVTFANSVIKLNARTFPTWCENVFERVTDYNDVTSTVAEPAALALYAMSKTINDTTSADNRENLVYALRNNPDVNTTNKLVNSFGILDMEV